MKTRRMLLFALTLLLSVAGIQSAMAQASQDALYIFRNDGQFNAFFFGDIDHIEYSKVDTLGVEQADYVVQEVYALDSVFRIPVSAIDSVAFTTPETKIKQDVFCPDKSIADYIVASDSVYWIRLATNTPAALIPKVGDKLLIEDESQFIPDGFGGLVTAVTEGSDGITVMTSALALTEVYEQLYVKLAGASPDMQPVQTSRRGPLEGVDITVPEEEIVIPTVSQTITLKKSQALLPDNSYVELNGEVQGSMSLTVSTKMRLRAFLTITPFTGFRYYQETFLDTETESALALTGGLSGRLEVPFIPAPIHTIKKGQLKVEVGVGLFLEAQATALSLTLKNSKSEKTRVNVTLEDDDINLVPPVFNPYYRWSSYCEKDTTELDFQFMGQYSVGLGAFAKAEAKLSIPIEKTPKFVQAWTKTDSLGFKATLGLDIGTKLEYAGPIVTSVPTDLMQTIPIYKELNKGNVSLSAYFKFVASLSLCNWTPEYAPEVKFWEPINRGLVPNITSIKVSQDKEQPIRPYRLLLSSTTEDRHILLGTKVGFAVLDANQKVEKDSLCAFYWVAKDAETWRNSAYDCVFKLDPAKGEYKSLTAYPMVELLGSKLLGDQKFDFKLDPARIDISEREIFIGKDLGSREIEVVPNMENMMVKAEGEWLNQTAPSWLDHKNLLTIYWPDLPENIKDRRGVIRLTGKSQTGETLVEDSIVVVQYEPFMELSATSLEFSEKGGTKTITILKTNVKDIKVSTNSEEIKATLEDKTITVTMGRNYTDQPSGGTVYVEGKAPNGQTISFPVTVTQERGYEPDPDPEPQGPYLKIYPKLVEADPEGDSIVVSVKYKDVENVKIYTELSSNGFLFWRTNFENDKLTVVLKRNTPLEERNVRIILEGQNAETGKWYHDTLTVVQPPHDKSIKGLLSLGGYLKLKYAYDKYDDFFEKWVHYEELIDDAIKSFKTDNNTTATQSLKSEDLGNGRLGIKMSYEYPYPDKDGYQNKYVSFELPNGYESETIENFKYIVKAKDAYWFDFADVTIEIASIPLTKKEQETDTWGWDSGTMKFSGSLESGVKLTSVKYHIISWTGFEEKGETASDPTQNVEVTLSWGTDPDAIKRANK